jgi:hypothetical protein
MQKNLPKGSNGNPHLSVRVETGWFFHRWRIWASVHTLPGLVTLVLVVAMILVTVVLGHVGGSW